jgi:hypothetical protein
MCGRIGETISTTSSKAFETTLRMCEPIAQSECDKQRAFQAHQIRVAFIASECKQGQVVSNAYFILATDHHNQTT